MIGAGAMLLTHEHDHSGPEPLVFREEREDNFTRALDKKIGKDVWIYASRILAGCTAIANGVVVAAGSVVTRPIEEPYTIWAGVPARKIGKR
jgi:acetyltransferase-like isoleucine patch superfamily enzyme